jgi:MarR family transcriptional regulator, organic hydroperoxide resistance regulator
VKQNAMKNAARASRPPDVGIGRLLRRAHMAFSRELRDRLTVHQITIGEFTHLDRLWTEDGLNQTELSHRVGIETASSTAILESLEKRGYIRRERDSGDRRNINVHLKPAGRELKRKLLACAKEVNLIARRGLPELDVIKFFSLLSAIADNLERHNSKIASREFRSSQRVKLFPVARRQQAE